MELSLTPAMLAGDTKVDDRPLLGWRDEALVPCPEPSVMSKTSRDGFIEYESLLAKARSLREQAWQIEQSIPQAQAEAKARMASAARAGETLADTSVAALEAEVKALREQEAAVKQAARDALADAVGLLGQDSGAWKKADDAVGKAYAEALAIADELDAAIAKVAKATSARSWVGAVKQGSLPPRHKVKIASSLSKPNDTPYTLTEVVGLLRAGIEEQIAKRAERAQAEQD